MDNSLSFIIQGGAPQEKGAGNIIISPDILMRVSRFAIAESKESSGGSFLPADFGFVHRPAIRATISVVEIYRHRGDPKNAGKGDKDHTAGERAGSGVHAAASAGYPVGKREGNDDPHRNQSASAFPKSICWLIGSPSGKSRGGVRRGKMP